MDFSWKDRGSLLAHLPSARALSSCPHLCQLLLTLLLNLVSGRTSSEVGHGHFSFSMPLLSFVVSLVLYPLGIGSERFESISRNVSERESRGLLNLTHLAYTLLPLFSLQLARLHGPGARSPTGAGT